MHQLSSCNQDQSHEHWLKVGISQLSQPLPVANQINCFKVYFSAENTSLSKQFLKKLSPLNQEKLAQFKQVSDQNRFLVSRLLLEFWLKKFDSSPVDLRLNPSGKPFLPGNSCEFNLSHSGDMVLFSETADSPIGVDVEKIQLIDDYEAFRGIFHPLESSQFKSIAQEKNSSKLIQTWVQKEAILKALGLGMQMEMSSIQINEDHRAVTLPNEFSSEWSLFNLKPCENHLAAIASPRMGMELNTYSLEISEFL